MPQATMVNPELTGDDRRVEVESGSDMAQGYFGSGYFLETGYNEETGESTWDAGETPITPEPEEEAPTDPTAETQTDEFGGRFDHITDPNKKAFAENQYQDAGSPDSFTINWDGYEATTDETEISQDQEDSADIQAENQLLREDHLGKIDDYSKTLKAQNQAIIDDIKRTFDIRQRAMEQVNKATLGGLKVAGARSGRQRYATEIQSGIISSEERAGIQRLADLDAQEQSLILQAEMAAAAKDFELLNERYNLVMEIQNQKEQTLLNLRAMAHEEDDRLMNTLRFNREKESWAKEDAGIQLESLMSGGFDLSVLSDEEYTKLESDLGLTEGTLEGFYSGLKEAQQAEEIGNDIQLQQAIQNLLNSTPEGMEITIGDKTYKGLSDTVDRTTYTYVDGATNKQYQIVIDKKTGKELYRKDMGQAYKYTNNGDGDDDTEDDSESIIRSDIEQATGEDKYVNPNEMKRIRQTIAQDEPGLLSWFDKAFPPKAMLNPDYYNVDASDTWLKDFD